MGKGVSREVMRSSEILAGRLQVASPCGGGARDEGVSRGLRAG
jgi:hypothetical protein